MSCLLNVRVSKCLSIKMSGCQNVCPSKCQSVKMLGVEMSENPMVAPNIKRFGRLVPLCHVEIRAPLFSVIAEEGL